MLKKLFSFFLACVLVVGLIPLSVRAEAAELAEGEAGAAWNDMCADFTNTGRADNDIPSALLETPRLSGAVTTDAGDNEYGEAENNNSMAYANIIENDYTVYGDVSGYDLDFYVFELAKASEVSIISLASTQNLMFGLYNSTGEALLGVSYDLGYDSGYYYGGFVGDLVAGEYYLVFLEADAAAADYMFYFEYTATSGSHSHSYFPSVYEPECESDGYTVYNCSCGKSYTADYVSALGHDIDPESYWFYGTGKNVMEHRCTCTRCGSSIKEPCSLEPVVVTDPTWEQPGVVRYTCTKCNTSCTDYYPYRIYGTDRCETARKAADELRVKLGVEKFDTIIVASGDEFADALAGSYLANVKHAPILLHRSSQMEENVEYITYNLAEGGTVYILGGDSAVPKTMENALEGYTVKRLGGNTRFETNVAILDEAGVSGGQLLVCTGYAFADSLSASATGLPILLVNNGSTELNETQTAYLEELNLSSITIIGGNSAVNDELAAELAAYGSVNRLGGTTRFETSVLVAETFFEAPSFAILAYGWNFPDGLCGGALASAMNVPLILTADDGQTAAAAYAQRMNISYGITLGGPILISDDTVAEIFDFASNFVIPEA